MPIQPEDTLPETSLESSRLVRGARPADEARGTAGLLPAAILANLQRRMFKTPGPTAAPTIGRYTIVRVLGQGAFGTVYEAVDPRLDRRVAIKVLSVSDRAATDVLEREARALAKLSHPNVVTIYEVGTTSDDRLFLAMELVLGHSLRAHQEATGAWRELVPIYVQAARGLAAIHEAGIVHGDFKPDNVLVGSDGRVRVADFGLARLRATTVEVEGDGMLAATDDPGATVVMGTPRYMAPEQHQGHGVDARSDQYAFCVALFEAVYREHPFGGETLTELREAIGAGRVRVPAIDRRHRPPRWLRELLVRGLERDRDRRFSDMGALLRELERDRRTWKRRTVVAATVLSAIAITYAVTATPAPWETARARAELDFAGTWNPERVGQVRETMLASPLAYAADTWSILEPRLGDYASTWRRALAESSAGDVTPTFPVVHARIRCLETARSELDALLVVLREAESSTVTNAVEAVSLLRPPARCLDDAYARSFATTDAGDAAAIDALRVRLARAKALRIALRSREALAILRPLREEAMSIDDTAVRAEIELETGEALEDDTEFEESAESYAAATYLASGAGMYDLAVAAAAGRIITVGYHLRRTEALARWMPQAEALVERAGPRSLAVAHFHTNRGAVRELTGDLDGAVADHERSLAIKQEILPPTSADIATSLNNLGSSAETRGELELAERYHTEALRIWTASLGPGHPYLSYSAYNLGLVRLRLGAIDEAEVLMEQARAVWVPIDPRHTVVALADTALARIALARKRWDQAERLAGEGAALLETVHGADHAFVAHARATRAAALLGLGHGDRARADLEAAVETLRKGAQPDWIADAELTLAKALLETGGDRGHAREAAARARATYREFGPAGAAQAREAEDVLDRLGPDPASPHRAAKARIAR